MKPLSKINEQGYQNPPIIKSIDKMVYIQKLKGYQCQVKWRANHLIPPCSTSIFLPQSVFHSPSLIDCRLNSRYHDSHTNQQTPNFHEQTNASNMSLSYFNKSNIKENSKLLSNQYSKAQQILKSPKKAQITKILEFSSVISYSQNQLKLDQFFIVSQNPKKEKKQQNSQKKESKPVLIVQTKAEESENPIKKIIQQQEVIYEGEKILSLIKKKKLTMIKADIHSLLNSRKKRKFNT